MQITKCDICKKKTKKEEQWFWVLLRGKGMGTFEICQKCGEPIKRLLKKIKLLK